MVGKKIGIYLPIGVAIIGALLSIVGGGALSIAGGLLAGFGALFAILFYKYGYAIFPFISKLLRMETPVSEDYTIPPSQDVIVKKGSNGLYYASAFLGIKIYESASERTTEENIAYNKYFERAISNFKYPVKVAYLLHVEDISEKRKMIETKRAEIQLRLNREQEKPEPDVLKLDRYERELRYWDLQLQRLVKGIKPMGILIYAQTVGVGVSKDGAIAAARAQAREVKSTLESVLNVEIEHLTADQMLLAFEWERIFPTSPEELEDAV